MIYKFRAECVSDIVQLLPYLIEFKITIIKASSEPDAEVELECNFSLEELITYLRCIEDGHVMVQTVALKEQYTGERNYDL